MSQIDMSKMTDKELIAIYEEAKQRLTDRQKLRRTTLINAAVEALNALAEEFPEVCLYINDEDAMELAPFDFYSFS